MLTIIAVLLLPIGSARVADAGPGGVEVCAYMDRLKDVWGATEPSVQEKTALRRLSERFQGGTRDVKDLDTLEASLASFGTKVQRRITGTRALAAPTPAAEVRRQGLEFLSNVDEVLQISRKLVKAMRARTTDADWVDQAVDRLQWLDANVRLLGGRFNREVVRVRNAYGCGPP
jgi:hypothetical protein